MHFIFSICHTFVQNNDDMEQIKPDTLLIYLTVDQFTSLLKKYLSP